MSQVTPNSAAKNAIPPTIGNTARAKGEDGTLSMF
jgi:hypothetical protein